VEISPAWRRSDCCWSIVCLRGGDPIAATGLGILKQESLDKEDRYC
jgi:hypothetical protein